VYISVLGPLAVSINGNRVDLGGAKQQKVLHTLVLARGSVVSNERLISLVWGEHPPSKPNVTLRTYISHLRKTLEPNRQAGDRARVLLTRSPGYVLDVAPEQVDLIQFEGLVTKAQSEQQRSCIEESLASAHRALEFWPSPGPDAIEALGRSMAPMHSETAHLTELHLRANDLEAQALLSLGRPGDAAVGLQHAVRCHPRSERLGSLLMLALYRTGRAPAALDVFQTTRRALAEELGLYPSPLLTNLEQQILQNDPTLLEEAPASLRPNSSHAVNDLDRTTGPRHPAPIGRADELAQLAACLPGRKGRDTNAAVVIGPAGIGKTTLITAFAAEASAGSTVILSRCHEVSSAATLAPWITALQDLHEEARNQAGSIFGMSAAQLAPLVPGIAEQFSVTTKHIPETGTLNDAVIRTLRRFTKLRGPLVLVFEDLHWADVASIQLLSQAQAELADAALTVAATWRDTDAAVEAGKQGARHARTLGLADLARGAGACRLSLDGLDTEAAAHLFRKLHAAEPDLDQLARLVAHTAGNPLYLTELLRAGQNGELPRPTDTVRDAVHRRLDPLPPGTEDLLVVAALCWAGFDEVMLSEVSDLGVPHVLTRMEAALAARLIEDHPDHIGQFRFSHDLLAETLAGQLRPGKKAAIHARIGAVLEKRQAPADQIAHHYLRGAGAGSSIGGARFAHQAAQAATEMSDHQGAVALLESALEALALGPDATLLRMDVQLDLAQNLKHLRRQEDSHDHSMAAFNLALNEDNIEFMVSAALVFAGYGRADRRIRGEEWLGYWAPPGPGVDMLERSLARMPNDHPERPTMMLVLSFLLYGPFEDPERSVKLALTGLELATKAGDRVTACEGLFTVCSSRTRDLPAADRQEMLEESVRLAIELDRPRTEVGARRLRMALALDRGDLATAFAEVDEASKAAAKCGQPLVRLQAEVMAVAMALLQGRFDEAEQRLSQGFAEFDRYGQAVLDLFGMQYGRLRMAHGHLDEVEAMLHLWIQGYQGPAYSAPLTAVLARNDKFTEAASLLEGFSNADLTSCGEGVLQYSTPSFFADAVADLGDTKRAKLLIPTLEPGVGRLVHIFGGVVFLGPTSLHLGRLHTVLGNFDKAGALFTEATNHANQVGATPDVVRILLARAELEAAAGQGQPSALVDEAQAMAEPLGMSWMVDRSARRLAPVD